MCQIAPSNHPDFQLTQLNCNGEISPRISINLCTEDPMFDDLISIKIDNFLYYPYCIVLEPFDLMV